MFFKTTVLFLVLIVLLHIFVLGQYRPVTDDPETMRLKKNTENQSSVAYRTDPSSMNYTPVSGEDPEMQRLKKNSEIQSSVKYRGVGTSENPPYEERQTPSPFNSKHGKNNTSASSNLTNQHQFKPNPAGVSANERASFVNALDSQQATMKQQVLMQEQQRRMQIEQQQKQIEEQQRLQAESRRKDELELQKQQNFERQQAEIMEKQRVERLEQEKRRRAEEEERQRQYAEQERSRQLQQAENRRRKEEEERRLAAEREEQLRFETEQKLRLNDPHVPVNNLNSATQAVNGNHHQPQEPAYRAEYDYFPDASDPEAADELMFEEGDIIVGLVKIDDGWSTGTNQRTGQSGMLPSNYITQIQ